MKPLIIVFLLIHTVSSKNHCDKGCEFKEPSITHDTIQNWPSSCKKVCGDIVIKAGNNLTESELKSAFSELANLNGNLIIEYTNFENLDFLSRKIKFSSEFNAEITICFNPNLTNVNAIDSWTTDGSFVWNIYENPKLDFEQFCNKDRGTWNIDLNVYGNLKNCDCNSVRLNSGSLPFYPNCTSIDGGRYNGLRITDVKSDSDLSGLLELKKVTGVLEIFDSNLRNLSFLRNLETIDISSSFGGNIIDIYGNPELKTLGFGSLKNLIPNKDGLRISLAWNHPDLCLTINELQLFVDNNVELYSDPEVKICQDRANVCKFDDLSTMDEDCRYLIGKVVVNSKNEEFAWKLENVTNIYGSMIIQGTKKMTDLNFLRHLRQVASVEYYGKKPLIQFNSNKKLQSTSLPSFRQLYPENRRIGIMNNELKIFKNKTDCLSFEKAMNATVEYNGFSCKKECNFPERYITSETLEFWPSSCKKVCGSVIIGAENNLTEAELVTPFKNLTKLIGNITIEYTSFETLNFLPRKTFVSESYYKTGKIVIRFNPNLKNVNVFDSWITEGPFVWNIYENPKLDFEPFCSWDLDSYHLGFNVYGNLKDCGCNSVRISSGSLPYYPNCTTINGGRVNGLRFSDVNPDVDDFSGLLKLEKITGTMDIHKSNLRNLSFLGNLKTIDLSLSKEDHIIYIHENSQLKSLGFNSLENLIPNEKRLWVALAFNHPNFCISLYELQLFIDKKVYLFTDLKPKICKDWNLNDGKKVCKYLNLEAINMDCQYLVGNVTVNSKNENFAWKLGNISRIYGSIAVLSTKELVDLSFLANLEQVADTHYYWDSPLIQIKSNKKLQTISMPRMKRVYPYHEYQFIQIKNNNLKLFKNKTECFSLEKALNTTVEYNGSSCGESFSEKQYVENIVSEEFTQKKKSGTEGAVFF